MAPTILVVGATGNTGRAVVENLPKLLEITRLASHRILALTRSVQSPSAQALAKLPDVELAEQNWVEITQDWLRKQEVVRVFMASHNEPTQFADEGQFLVNALKAGVQYLVRISTTAANVRPDLLAYYPRTHWALETMLSQPEFESMHFSSLQPNNFSTMSLASVAQFIKEFRRTGQQTPLSLMFNRDVPSAMIHPYDVGVFAAHLLVQTDTTRHNGQRYVLNGPEDVTGEQIIKIAEEYIGEPVKEPRYADLSTIDEFVENYMGSKNLIGSIKHAPEMTWAGKAKTDTTSEAVPSIYAPKLTVRDALSELLKAE